MQGTTSTRSNALGAGYTFSGSAAAGSTGNYTLFHVARYRGGNSQRIFNGVGFNWLSGFWGNCSGVQYHEGWLTEGDKHGQNWVISADQHNFYRSNGVTRGLSGNGAYNVTVDLNSSEASDFHIAEVILYDRALTLSEIQGVESYLADKYGITIG